MGARQAACDIPKPVTCGWSTCCVGLVVTAWASRAIRFGDRELLGRSAPPYVRSLARSTGRCQLYGGSAPDWAAPGWSPSAPLAPPYVLRKLDRETDAGDR
jgi:hypothetical protein